MEYKRWPPSTTFQRNMGLFQPTLPPLPKSLSFEGKTVLVTGANSGLGLAASYHFAQRKVTTLILAVRTVKSGEATKAALLADPIVSALPTKPTILVYELDLGRPSSVKSFASKILAHTPDLNIVLLNAGIGSLKFETSPEEPHNELHFQVNYLSNAFLSIRFLPLLRSTAQRCGSRSYISIVGSRMQTMSSFIKSPIPDTTSVFAFLNSPKDYNKFTRYGDSKLLVSTFIRELAQRTDASLVIMNAVCPGMVHTSINTKQPLLVRAITGVVFAIRARTAAVGAQSLINAVTAGPEIHGEQLGDYTVWENKFLETEEGKKMERRLWAETLAAVEKDAPGSVQNAGLE
ncbi:hypothetical protein FB45DRAFT_904639 [Roridomyces roridus]|uniref:Uncharacterized protein n=1 Tax=Roridomyces roridus TaxID=1738132 RepID=A0AAD7FRI5_9AGAR|nr:hypothetical protein FB45DRAFT_904639 [Roridomyces roridus]